MEQFDSVTYLDEKEAIYRLLAAIVVQARKDLILSIRNNDDKGYAKNEIELRIMFHDNADRYNTIMNDVWKTATKARGEKIWT